jgi:hypothetical protein
MMHIMEKVTDKPRWHEKVFEDSIVSKWREEALRIPDEDLWALATSGKQQLYKEGGSVTVQALHSIQGVVPLKGILTANVFDLASICCHDELILLLSSSASVNFETRLSTTRNVISYLHLMRTPA